MEVKQLKITKVLEKITGQKKDGSGDWVKLSFVGETDEQYNNLYCFELFGDEKVDNFEKYNKVGSVVDVDFNVSTNEWKDKYYTSLQAWKVFKSDTSSDDFKNRSGLTEAAAVVDSIIPPADESQDDLPF